MVPKLYKVAFLSVYFSAELMSNKQTEEQQCRDGTVALAEAVLDSLSTGVKITVMFVVIVVSFPSVISRIAQDPQVSAAPVVTGSLEVPEHPVHPVSSPQGTEVLVDSVHSGEVPVGGVAVPSSSPSNSGNPGRSGEDPVGGVAVPIPSGSSSDIGGLAGGVSVRDVPVSIVSGGVPPRVLPAGEVPARVPVPIVGGGIPPFVQPVGEVPECATVGGRRAAPPGVGGIHPPAAFARPSRFTVTYGPVT